MAENQKKLTAMKKFAKQMFIAVLLLGCSVGVRAQEHKWEHSLFYSIGRFIDIDTYTGNDKGLTTKFGYGANRYFTENYSLMVGFVRHVDRDKAYDDSVVGYDEDDFVFLDIPILFQYHFNNNGFGNLMFGIGPVISHCIDNDLYEVTNDRYNGLNRKKKIKEYNYSIMPCVAYETRLLRIGVDANIGLRDVKRIYKDRTTGEDLTSGSKHLNNVCFTLGVKF